MKKTKVWISRDGYPVVTGWIKLSFSEPKRCGRVFTNDVKGISFHPATFKKKFGFTPRKGTCKKYNLTLEEVT